MNYVSASMNRSNTAAKDFQEKTHWQLVLRMAKKTKQTTKKEPIGTLSDADSLYCHANVQQKLEKRKKL